VEDDFCGFTLKKISRSKERFERKEITGPQREKVIVPRCISDYRKNMGGVDTLDQLMAGYRLNKRSDCKSFLPSLRSCFCILSTLANRASQMADDTYSKFDERKEREY